MAGRTEKTDYGIAAAGYFTPQAGADACAGLRDWLHPRGGRPDGAVRRGCTGAQAEFAGNPDRQLPGDATAGRTDFAIYAAGGVAVCLRASASAGGGDAAARIAAQIALGFRWSGRRGAGGLDGNCRAGSSADDAGAHSRVAKGSGAGRRIRGLKGS